MGSDPTLLAFDTSAAHCAAALLSGGQIRAMAFDEMARGQAERLMPLLEEVLTEAGLGWGDLDALGVGTGPGNFTGIRISVAAARGLALARGIDAIGVSGFDVLRGLAGAPEMGALAVHLPGPRDGRYWQDYRNGLPEGAPLYEREGRAPPEPGATLLGPEAEPLARAWGAGHAAHDAQLTWPEAIAELARIAAQRAATGAPGPRAAPLYVRPADAAPSREAGPVILT
ncbi:tRNA (adenosine(37)-N6)-threonylcarbamoyltransferase complex dimerization subunit type 1 TsaB [Roseivivax sp. GX 12232]|uniref:tRNA (adenosine(37)-N6)-threonylcarbamoyltransferase complex dimerization subunit type 1 TsaB n=1 Tax=Roseivivax sp. GX 12232 TaxID=2900547 RepID=UPI001E2926C5|nr:tRNA (adenosine(37)-N6)-threonylcarbamoyltransferase complex dimerization subunit type 1 TsaB [Roseivivax sp. GX 12232]MCE0505759.1 tRNA (adenosine(37)-N6)-threonylcarbamoyltransferase complex dimerization subunit type 1 TsaB [Roseivivax sp. GX 12232]